ncbi:MAG: PASTA domain-containing protein [Chlorobium sp.]|jgi:hypothetical protein|nr:PASTA domain-containing protein [Chlorobium sp.]
MNFCKINNSARRIVGDAVTAFCYACYLAFFLGLFSSAAAYALEPEKYLAVNTMQSPKPVLSSRRAILPLRDFSSVQVPDLTGQPVDSAIVIIRRSGFELGGINLVESATASGIVISQRPAPKDQPRAVRGSAISLDVSKPMMSVVPDVVGQPFQSARSMLEKAGFATSGHFSDSLKSSGIVSIQNPKGDTPLERGAIVELTVTFPTLPENVPEPVSENPPDQNADNNPLPDQPPVDSLPQKPAAAPVEPAANPPFPVNTLLITGGAIIILGAGALLLSRIRRTNLKSTVEKKVTVYAKIDYGQQQLNAESILPDLVAGKSDLSIRLLPDIGVQEIQGKGSLVKSE